MNHMFKKLSAVCAAAAMLFASGCTQSSSTQTNSVEVKPTTGSFTVTAIDVGKADAIVLQTENTVTVIDAGNKGDGKYVDKLLAAQGIDTIDTLIITHFDKDHVGGATRVVNRMNVKTIYVPDYTSELDEYKDFMEKVSEKGITPTVLPAKTTKTWTDDDVTYQMFAANQASYGKNEENDYSIVLYAVHGENTYLFTGDAEAPRQAEIMDLKLGKVKFLKYPYHGNYMSTTEAFLDACDPTIAVVCCSKTEYADPSTVETLRKRGVVTYYTCDTGTVTFVSDGKTIKKRELPSKKNSGDAADSDEEE